MSNDPIGNVLDKFRAEFEAMDRTTKGALDRMRSVIYQNKKDLEGPIYRNKLDLDTWKKRSGWALVVIVIQAGLLIWTTTEMITLRGEVTSLSQGVEELQNTTVKDLQRMEGTVEQINKQMNP